MPYIKNWKKFKESVVNLIAEDLINVILEYKLNLVRKTQIPIQYTIYNYLNQ